MNAGTTARLRFGGVDITEDVARNLLSLSYTDDEEDSADDLQLRLTDREGLWRCGWLDAMLRAAAGVGTVRPQPSGLGTYEVTARIGLNVRTGPGLSYAKLGALSKGAKVQPAELRDGWARFPYAGKEGWSSLTYLKRTDAPAGISAAPRPTMKLEAELRKHSREEGGADEVLQCGEFCPDAVSLKGGPAVLTIKASALAYSAVRQEKHSKAWEAYRLRGIAEEIARANGLGCLFLSGNDPFYDRKEQRKISDISFLKNLCKDAGISLKVTNSSLVLFDQSEYDKKPAVRRILASADMDAGGEPRAAVPTSYDFKAGKANTAYASCRVRYTVPWSGKVIEGIAYAEDYDPESPQNRQLELTERVSDIAEAEELAAKRLRLANKYARTGSLTLPGDPALLAGLTVDCEGFGWFDGHYAISRAVHTLDQNGYRTQLTLRTAV